MTSPSNDFAAFLPFSIRYKIDVTSAYLIAEDGQRTTGYSYVPPAGVYQIQLAYTGPEAAEVWWAPAGPGMPVLNICKIPADPSGNPRSSKLVTIQANGVGRIQLTTTPRPNSGSAQPTSTASLHVYPLPE